MKNRERCLKLRNELIHLHKAYYSGMNLVVKDGFVGFKDNETDKYYRSFLHFKENEWVLALRNDVNARDVKKLDVIDWSDEKIIELICSYMQMDTVREVPAVIENIILNDDAEDDEFPKDDEESEILHNTEWIMNTYSVYKIKRNVLSKRLYNVLINNTVDNVALFLVTPTKEMEKFPGCGKKCIREAKKIKKEIWTVIQNQENLDKFIWDGVTLEKEELRKEFLNEANLSLEFRMDENEKEKYVLWAMRLAEETLKCLQERLNERDFNVFKHRMSFIESDCSTLREIGKEFVVSGERIRQIIEKIKKRSRGYLSSIYVRLLNEMPLEDLLNAMYYGVVESYNAHFLKFILEVVDKEWSGRIMNKIEEELSRFAVLEKKRILKRKMDHHINAKIKQCITFPYNVNYQNKDFFYSLKQERQTSDENNNGTITTKKFGNVEYESAWEKKVIEQLDCCDLVVDMKAQAYIIIYEVNGKEHKYYPDFVLLMKDGSVAFLEVKAPMWMFEERTQLKYSALKEFCEQHGMGYAMIRENFVSFEMLLNKTVDATVINDFITFVRENGVINFGKFARYKEEKKLDFIHTLVAVMQNRDIVFRRSPFEFVSRGGRVS